MMFVMWRYFFPKAPHESTGFVAHGHAALVQKEGRHVSHSGDVVTTLPLLAVDDPLALAGSCGLTHRLAVDDTLALAGS